VTSFSGDKTLTFSGLATSASGAVPTVTSKTSAAVNEGTFGTDYVTSGVSSAGGILVAKKWRRRRSMSRTAAACSPYHQDALTRSRDTHAASERNRFGQVPSFTGAFQHCWANRRHAPLW